MPISPDVLRRFAPLATLGEPERIQLDVRGPALALAQHWAMTLPDGPGKAKALDALADAADLACEAYGPN